MVVRLGCRADAQHRIRRVEAEAELSAVAALLAAVIARVERGDADIARRWLDALAANPNLEKILESELERALSV